MIKNMEDFLIITALFGLFYLWLMIVFAVCLCIWKIPLLLTMIIGFIASVIMIAGLLS